MKKNRSKKGFTLAELLVVVAIIGVLVAIAIPTFTAQLKKARIATDDANIRAAYSQYVTSKLTDGVEVTTASKADVEAALTAIGVTELKEYSDVTISGNSWTGTGTGGVKVSEIDE